MTPEDGDNPYKKPKKEKEEPEPDPLDGLDSFLNDVDKTEEPDAPTPEELGLVPAEEASDEDAPSPPVARKRVPEIDLSKEPTWGDADWFRDSYVWRTLRRRTELFHDKYDAVTDLQVLKLISALMPAVCVRTGTTTYSPPRINGLMVWRTGFGKDNIIEANRKALQELGAKVGDIESNAPEQLIGSLEWTDVWIAEPGAEDAGAEGDADVKKAPTKKKAKTDKRKRLAIPNKGKLGNDYGYNPEASDLVLDEKDPLARNMRSKLRRANNDHPKNIIEHHLTHHFGGLHFKAHVQVDIGLQPSRPIPRNTIEDGTWRRFTSIPEPDLTPEDRKQIMLRRDKVLPGFGAFDATNEEIDREELGFKFALTKVLTWFGGTPFNPLTLEPRGDDKPFMMARRGELAHFAGLLERAKEYAPRFTEAEFAEVKQAIDLLKDWFWAWRVPGLEHTVPDIIFDEEATTLMTSLRERRYDEEALKPGGAEWVLYFGMEYQRLFVVLSALTMVYFEISEKNSETGLTTWDDHYKCFYVQPAHVQAAYRIWDWLAKESTRVFLQIAGRPANVLAQESQYCLWWVSQQSGAASVKTMLKAAYKQFGVAPSQQDAWRQRFWKVGVIRHRLGTSEHVIGDALAVLTPDGMKEAKAIAQDLVAEWKEPT